MASAISIPETDMTADRTRRNRKRRSAPVRDDIGRRSLARWKSDAQHQIYSSSLLQALSRVCLNSPSPSAPRGGRAVREAADRALAVAAKGRTRWSRAILTGRLKLKFRKRKRQRSSTVAAGSSRRSSRKSRVNVVRLNGKSLPAVQRRVRVLGRLVPGCRKEPLPVILEEATDYIAALEMQVRAMSALANLLSASISNPPPT